MQHDEIRSRKFMMSVTLTLLALPLTVHPAAAAPGGGQAVFVGDSGETYSAGAGAAYTWVSADGEEQGEEGEKREVRVVVVGDEEGEKSLLLGPPGAPYQFRTVGDLARRGFLGVQLVDLTPELRTHFGASEDAGVLIGRVEPDSPAATAGFEVGDVLTSLDGEPMASSWEVGQHVRGLEEGDTVDAEVLRDGRRLSLTATIVERERTEVDIRRFLELHQGSGPSFYTVHPGEIEVQVGKLRERLESPEFGARIRTLHSLEGELEKRIEELEKRLQELERQMEENR